MTYLKIAKECKEKFEELEIKQIAGEENLHADALANLGSVIQITKSKEILIVYMKWPFVWKEENEEVYELTKCKTWITPLIYLISNDIILNEKNKAHQIKHKSERFTIIEGRLYRRSYYGPY